MKIQRYAISAPLLVIGALFAFYGVFALTFNGDGSGRTYINIARGQMDAHVAGGISLAIAAVLIGSSLLARNRGRRASD